jgi:hypothetical protein
MRACCWVGEMLQDVAAFRIAEVPPHGDQETRSGSALEQRDVSVMMKFGGGLVRLL